MSSTSAAEIEASATRTTKTTTTTTTTNAENTNRIGSLIDSSLFTNNPGSYEDLHKKTKGQIKLNNFHFHKKINRKLFIFNLKILDVFPIIFEGFKFTLNKALSTHFQINHSLTMSSVVPSSYKFGATYVGNKQYSSQEVP
jgi:hypothetical protein